MTTNLLGRFLLIQSARLVASTNGADAADRFISTKTGCRPQGYDQPVLQQQNRRRTGHHPADTESKNLGDTQVAGETNTHMKLQPNLPEGIIPFDYETHLGILNAYVAKNEDALYKLNGLVGNKLTKSDGIRMTFDVLQMQSMVYPERKRILLTFGPSYIGTPGPATDVKEIAGVLGDQMWFNLGGQYISSDDELEALVSSFGEVAEKLKSVQDIFRKIAERDDDGEEWKEEQP